MPPMPTPVSARNTRNTRKLGAAEDNKPIANVSSAAHINPLRRPKWSQNLPQAVEESIMPEKTQVVINAFRKMYLRSPQLRYLLHWTDGPFTI